MNAESLAKFLKGRTRARDVAAEIQDEVGRYREGLARTGTSVPVIIVGDHSKIRVTASGFLEVCSGYLSGDLSKWDVHYICDALSLSDAEFASERLRELLEEFANPEIRAEEITQEEVLSMRDKLVSLGAE